MHLENIPEATYCPGIQDQTFQEYLRLKTDHKNECYTTKNVLDNSWKITRKNLKKSSELSRLQSMAAMTSV